MTDKDEPGENIFHIVDGIVQNVDRTKKIVVLLIIAFVVSIPLSFHITSTLVHPPYSYGPARVIVPFFVILAFIVLGIRQWIVLSKWTKKYKAYKSMQEKIDKEFDFGNDDKGGEEKPPS